MNDSDYIRAAVELADGWIRSKGMSRMHLDALAAQLVRQVYSHSVRPIEVAGPIHYDLYDPVNTIKLIVDSEVLN